MAPASVMFGIGKGQREEGIKWRFDLGIGRAPVGIGSRQCICFARFLATGAVAVDLRERKTALHCERHRGNAIYDALGSDKGAHLRYRRRRFEPLVVWHRNRSVTGSMLSTVSRQSYVSCCIGRDHCCMAWELCVFECYREFLRMSRDQSNAT